MIRPVRKGTKGQLHCHPVGILAKPKFARTGSRNESSKAAHILDSGRVSFSPFEKNTAGMTDPLSFSLLKIYFLKDTMD
jgi:hypothetical protein